MDFGSEFWDQLKIVALALPMLRIGYLIKMLLPNFCYMFLMRFYFYVYVNVIDIARLEFLCYGKYWNAWRNMLSGEITSTEITLLIFDLVELSGNQFMWKFNVQILSIDILAKDVSSWLCISVCVLLCFRLVFYLMLKSIILIIYIRKISV